MFNTSVTDALFGGSNSFGSGSIFSASNFGDLALMKSGVYKKMMRSYVSQLQEGSDEGTKTEASKPTAKKSSENMVSQKMEGLRATATAGESELSKANKALSAVKSAAGSLEKASSELSGMNFDTSSKEDVYQVAKTFVNSYNSLLAKAGKIDNASIEQSVTWMKADMKEQAKKFEKIGITIGKDGSLAIDEEKFTSANFSDIRPQFEGEGTVIGRTGMRAGGVYNLAANQIYSNIGSTTYSSSGVLK